MSLHALQEEIEDTVTKWTPEMKRDLKAAMALAQIGGEQSAFTDWLIDEIQEKGKKGWWNPMCLFRSYALRGSDPGSERSNRIRGEIRAATETPCPFRPGAWNKNYNKEIFQEWLPKNEEAVLNAMRKNLGSTLIKKKSVTHDCEVPSINELDEVHSKYFAHETVDYEKLFDKVEIEAINQGRVLCPDWRMTVENMLDDTQD